MAIGSALKFVNRIKKENDFRKKLYTYDTVKGLNDFLADENMAFTQEDFEDAIQKNRVEAQFEEIANEYSEIKEWWNMLSSGIQ